MTEVAVLLAACNGEKYLRFQVESILSQKGARPHVFISIDGCSEDGTHEIAAKLMDRYSNVSVLPHEKAFGGAARNFFWLVQNAPYESYDYIAFSDQDDIWNPGHLLRAVRILTSKGMDCYSSDVLAFWEETGKVALIKKSFPPARYDFFFEAAGPGCTYVVKKDVMVSFREFLGEHPDAALDVSLHDWLFYAFCRSMGYGWYIDEFPSVYYRQHGSNVLGANASLRAYMSRIKPDALRWYSTEVKKIFNLLNTEFMSELKLTRPSLIRKFLHLRRRPREKWFMLLLLLTGMFSFEREAPEGNG